VLQLQLGDGVDRDRSASIRICFEAEKRCILNGLGRWFEVVPPAVVCSGEFRRRRESRHPKDRVAEREIDASGDPDASGKQLRVPVRCAVPHPTRMFSLAISDKRAQVFRGNLRRG
jgi:hypothetical protein